MRITAVIGSLAMGGAEKSMVQLCDWLSRAGHEVTLLTQRRKAPDYYTPPPGVRRRYLEGYAPGSIRWLRVGAFLRRFAAMRRSILAEKPDLVISFSRFTNVETLLSLLFSGVPTIISERSDFNYERSDLTWCWRLLRRLSYPRASGVVFVVKPDPERVRSLLRAERIRIIQNSVEPPVPQDPQRPDWLGERNIVSAGRLHPIKGYDRLIRAFAALAQNFPDWRLTIFGEGGERGALERLIQELGLEERIWLPGRVQTPQRLYGHFDFYAQSSQVEGFCNALTEGMAAGLPAVSTECSGPSTIIRHGVDGLLVPVGDVPALGEALRRLMADDELRRSMAARAPEVVQRFSEEDVKAQWIDLVERVVQRKRRSPSSA